MSKFRAITDQRSFDRAHNAYLDPPDDEQEPTCPNCQGEMTPQNNDPVWVCTDPDCPGTWQYDDEPTDGEIEAYNKRHGTNY